MYKYVLSLLFTAGRRRRRQADQEPPEFDEEEVEQVRQMCESLRGDSAVYREGCLEDLEAGGPEVDDSGF